MKIVKLTAVLLLGLVVLVFAVIALNYFSDDIEISSKHGLSQPLKSKNITILNWNIGYAGLGEESDFVMDGGENLYPPSKDVVEKNLNGILGVLSQNKADLFQFQEVAKPNMLNLGVDVFGALKTALGGLDYIYSSDMNTCFIPKKWALHHGLASFSAIQTTEPEIIRLPNEDTRLGGILIRQFHMIKREFKDPDGRDWVVFNTHMAAFDEGGKTRTEQLKALSAIVSPYYKSGKHVVVGGDWNMQLLATNFPHTTEEKYLFWLKALPKDLLPQGWAIVADPSTPTVRSNERPYTKNENYTTIIDGFLVSPNVEIVNVKTLDTGFKYTDHQPVIATFKAKER